MKYYVNIREKSIEVDRDVAEFYSNKGAKVTAKA